MTLVQACKCVWTLSEEGLISSQGYFSCTYDNIMTVAPISALQYSSFCCDRCWQLAVFSAVLDHVPGSEHTIPLYHVPDHDSLPPQITLNDWLTDWADSIGY